MDKDTTAGCLWGVVALCVFIWWAAQPDTTSICIPEKHWWISSTLPTCAQEIDDLQARVSALEEKLHTNE
jgi:hypothetical protein